MTDEQQKRLGTLLADIVLLVPALGPLEEHEMETEEAHNEALASLNRCKIDLAMAHHEVEELLGQAHGYLGGPPGFRQRHT